MDQDGNGANDRPGRWAHPDGLPSFSPRDGISLKALAGDGLMVSWVRIEPNRELPIHRHPNEQIGVVLEGEIDVTIGGETRRVGPGAAYAVPPDAPHGGMTGASGCLVLETFAPPRADYLAALASVEAEEYGG